MIYIIYVFLQNNKGIFEEICAAEKHWIIRVHNFKIFYYNLGIVS